MEGDAANRTQSSSPPGDANAIRLAPGVRVLPGVLRFSAVRSEGPGGQNVNKRSTRIQLRVSIADLPLDAEALDRLARLAPGGVTSDGEIVIQSSTTRSQTRNRTDALERLGELVRRALVRPKNRRPTKPSRGAIQRRLTSKKQRSEVKQRRRPPKSEES
ncbi:MAG: alternative ribosome rescue aminoacyl-tRNA hydrolase ArfB [Planctomycetota bacterium]